MRTLRVVIAAVVIVAVVLAAQFPRSVTASIPGTITALGGTVTISLAPEIQSVAWQLSGTWTATVVFEASVDGGVSFFAVQGQNASTGAQVTSVTCAGTCTSQTLVQTSGFDNVRVRASAFTSGTVVVAAELSTGGQSAGSSVNLVTPSSTGTISAACTTPATSCPNNTFVSVSSASAGAVGVFISGTWTGTLTFQGSDGAGNYFTANATTYPIFAWVGPFSSVTSNSQSLIQSTGYAQVRVVATAWTSGTATVTLITNNSPLTYPTAATTGDANDNQPAQGSGVLIAEGRLFAYNGAGWDKLRVANQFSTPLNASACATETTIWTPTAGKRFRLMGIAIGSSVAGNLVFRDGTGLTIIFVLPVAAGGSIQQIAIGNGILSATVNNPLTITGPAAANCSGQVWGTFE